MRASKGRRAGIRGGWWGSVGEGEQDVWVGAYLVVAAGCLAASHDEQDDCQQDERAPRASVRALVLLLFGDERGADDDGGDSEDERDQPEAVNKRCGETV